MKAFDTPILLSLHQGEAEVRTLLRKLRGVEVATTEYNMLELSVLANGGSARHRAGRIKAIDRLRGKLTVLPITTAAVREATARIVGNSQVSYPPAQLAMLGALEAEGCDELYTDRHTQFPGQWRFKVTSIAPSHHK